MIIERARVVAVEPAGVWVEAVQKSVCAGCQVRQGCGQGLLAKYASSGGYLWVVTQGATLQVGEEIEFGLPDDVVVKSSLTLYLVPLLLLIAGAWGGSSLSIGDAGAILGALLGLGAGALLVRWHAARTRLNPRYQPQYLGRAHAAAACVTVMP